MFGEEKLHQPNLPKKQTKIPLTSQQPHHLLMQKNPKNRRSLNLLNNPRPINKKHRNIASPT